MSFISLFKHWAWFQISECGFTFCELFSIQNDFKFTTILEWFSFQVKSCFYGIVIYLFFMEQYIHCIHNLIYIQTFVIFSVFNTFAMEGCPTLPQDNLLYGSIFTWNFAKNFPSWNQIYLRQSLDNLDSRGKRVAPVWTVTEIGWGQEVTY